MSRKTKQTQLSEMLAARGLGRFQVWYRRKFPAGWMMGDDGEEGWYDRIGYNYQQAVGLINRGTADFLRDQPEVQTKDQEIITR